MRTIVKSSISFINSDEKKRGRFSMFSGLGLNSKFILLNGRAIAKYFIRELS